MNIAVLRAAGSDAALASLRSTLSLNISIEWKKGDPRRQGGIHDGSGFNVSVADVSTPVALVKEIREFLKKCKAQDAVLSSAELTTQLDIGIGVGLSEQYLASVVFTPDDMRSFSELGLELSVSAYPQSDGD